MNRLAYTQSQNPFHNLALEELLFERGEPCLYLWQNAHTVVIGRNQNAWKECRAESLEAAGGKLARRTSGGGAVYHDTGNLNFTFLVPREAYDLPRQLGVILAAVRALGIEADFTGRNDIVAAGGAKFSGNAFRFSEDMALHHGTILVSADLAALSAYLRPSPAKLAAKGIASVRSRVTNLAEFRPGLSIEAVAEAVSAAYRAEYGPYRLLPEADLDAAALRDKEARFASWDWRMGASFPFDAELSARFPWGEIALKLVLRAGRIEAAAAESDAMDEAFIRAIAPALRGVRFSGGEMADAIAALPAPEAAALADWLRSEGLGAAGAY